MRNTLRSAAFIALFLCASVAQAGTFYQLDMNVLHNGEQVAAPMVVVANGMQADLIIDNPKASSPKLRMLVSAQPGETAGSGRETISVKIMFFESVADAWVVVAEPDVDVFPSDEASLQIADSAKSGSVSYEIRLVASLFDPGTMSVGGEKVGAVASPEGPAGEGSLQFALASMFGMSTANASPSACCSVQNVTCCGAAACCNTVNNVRVRCTTNPLAVIKSRADFLQRSTADVIDDS